MARTITAIYVPEGLDYRVIGVGIGEENPLFGSILSGSFRVPADPFLDRRPDRFVFIKPAGCIFECSDEIIKNDLMLSGLRPTAEAPACNSAVVPVYKKGEFPLR
jgi:hypothetical protein